MPRRIPDYPVQFADFNAIASVGAFGFGLSQLLFVYILYNTLKKDVTVDGLQKTTYLKDEMDGKIAIREQVDVTSHLKHNKILTNLNDGYSKSRDLKRVASIPTLALSVWANEYNGTNNWFSLPKEVQKQILKKKLNSNEFQYFKTAEGNL